MPRRRSKFSIQSFSYKTLFIIVFFLLIAIVALLKLTTDKKVSAAWWNDSWMYRQTINISSHTNSESNVYITVTINIGSTQKSQPDNGDFRFINQNGQILPYFVNSGSGTTAPVFHINLNNFPSGSQDIYAYYGNSSTENGFSASDFSTQASNYTIGSYGAEEFGGGPIAYWKFDEGSGTTAYDSSSNKYNGTIGTGNSSPTWQTDDMCISGKCLFFNGSNSISLPNDLVPVSDIRVRGITYSAWVKPSITTNNYRIIGQKPSSGYSDFASGGIGIRSNKAQMVAYDDGIAYKYATGNTTLNPNQWYYITGTYDSSDQKIRIYVNGKLDGEAVLITTFNRLITNATNTIGYQIHPTDNYYYSGLMDEPKIYNYARTPDQIKTDYAAGKAHSSSNNSSSVNLGGNKNSGEYLSDGLVGYWKMDENVGTTTLDFSGNNTTGTFVGTTKPTWTLGKYSNGISFSGANDSLSIPYKPNFREAFTVSIWMKRTTDFNQMADVMFLSSPNAWYFYDSYNTGQIRGDVYIDGTRRGGIDVPVPFDNNWYHIAYTYDSATHFAKMYKNGTLFKTLEITGLTNYLIDAATNNLYNPGLNSKGRGIILDEARIYNRALSPSEIQDLYNWSPDDNSPKKPIVYYKFDEGYGTTVNNNGTGGNVLNGAFGTSTAAPLWTNFGKINKALDFNTTNNTRIKTPITDTNGLNIRGAISYSAWFKRKTTSGRHTLIDMLDSCASDGDGFYLRFTDNTLSFYGVIYAGTDPFVISYNNENITGDTNKWHHVVTTWNGTMSTNGVKMYIDGKLVAQSTANADATNMESLDGHSLSVGTLTCNTHSFDGLIDEVKIYNTALTEDEVKLDYNQGSSLSFGSNNQTIGGTTTSLDYCIPGDTSYCAAPVSEWKMDEGVGTSIVDTSGHNSGTVFDATWSQGKTGQAISFGSSNSYINIPSISPAITTSKITISGWFDLNSLSDIQRLISVSNSFPMFGLSSTTLFIHTTTSNGSDTNTPQITLPTNCRNGWHNISITWDTSLTADNINIYCDSINIGKATLVNSLNGNFNISSFWIGHNTQSFLGKVDNVRIYNYARTPAQVAYDYNKGAPIGWWKFDECQGSIVYDWSGIGNTGSINIGPNGSQNSLGTCQIGTSSAWTNGASGKYNSSLNFDGVDDYIKINNNSIFNLANTNHSFSLWFKSPSTTIDNPGMIFQRFTGGTPGAGYWIAVSSNKVYYENRADSGNYLSITSTNLYNDSMWHQVSITVDVSSKTAKMYIDGNYVASDTYSGNLLDHSSSNLTIGGQLTSYNYKGQIDDIHIYNYALTPDQIKTLYNNGAVSFQ
jgi:hypothetical protein